jgi:signal transduction histidine kinase
MAMLQTPPHPDQLAQVEQLLVHFEEIEAQFQTVREGLTHSHRLATLGTIATVIAHEYNNILTPVISYAQMALAQETDAVLMKKAVEKALQGALRAARISSSLLGFAREADQEHTACLGPTIDEAVACLAREPHKDGVTLVIDVPQVQVAMSPLNLQQVMLNLIINARKAMRRKGGTLTITGRAQKGMIHLQVKDTGPGIPPQIMDRLFEPFATHRIEQTDENGESHDHSPERKGTGLGLCICRDLIRNVGGSIRAESIPDSGAVFHIILPIADDLFETT